MKMKLQIACVLLGVATGTYGVVGDEELEWWESDHWTLGTLWNHFDCETVFESERQIPSTVTWMQMRQAYVNVVGSSKSAFGEPREVDGFFAPIEVRQSPGKGRGVFAAEDIPRGHHIWSGTVQRAKFDSGLDFMKFLDLIPDEDACDVLQYSFVLIFGDDKENEENARICVELDDGSIMNAIDPPDPVDAGCLPEWSDRFRGGCDDNLYALRDIKKGDEILMDYRASNIVTHGWKWFSLENHDEEDDEEDDEEHDGEDDEEHDEDDDAYPKCHGSLECCESDEWWKVDGCHIPDVSALLKCDDLDEFPIYRQADWKKLRQTYYAIVGKNASSIASPTGEDGFFVPFEKLESPRGLYAAQDIAIGQHIWTGTKQMAVFDNPTDYKTFLVSIPSDRACDILHYFGYVQIFNEDNGESCEEHFRIIVDLDDWAYVNFASDGRQASIGCLPEWNDQYIGGCKRNAYALRDIKKGEEILIEEGTSSAGLYFAWDRVELY
jgi:hypothetical protein